jgi:hypothetical protein
VSGYDAGKAKCGPRLASGIAREALIIISTLSAARNAGRFRVASACVAAQGVSHHTVLLSTARSADHVQWVNFASEALICGRRNRACICGSSKAPHVPTARKPRSMMISSNIAHRVRSVPPLIAGPDLPLLTGLQRSSDNPTKDSLTSTAGTPAAGT